MEERIRTFFEFVFDRQQVWHRRSRLCLPAPWSDDDILRNYRFCNVYRELDGGTQAIVKYLKQDISPEQKLFNIVAYRFFNRRDTIENLFGGLLEVENFNFKFLEQRFDEKKKHQSIFSNAYLITAHSFNPDYRPQDKHIQILLMLNDLRMRLKPLLAELQSSPAQDGPGIVSRHVPLAGAFLSGQILLDATYAGDIVPYTSDDFLVVGPGAHWGLDIIFGRHLSKKEAAAKCRALRQLQAEGFAELKRLKNKDWQEIRWDNPDYPGQPYLSLHDIQNSLCEFRKYWRLKHGEKAKRRYFTACSQTDCL